MDGDVFLPTHESLLSKGQAVRVRLKGLADTRRWETFGSSSVIGSAFLDNQNYNARELAEKFNEQNDLEDVIQIIERLNGFCALIVRRSDWLVAAVDRIRSIPLYYSVHGVGVVVSDDAHWVKSTVGDGGVDPVARAEFLNAGYVTLGDTLSPHVKQLRAGELLIVRLNPKVMTQAPEIAVSTRSYFVYSHSHIENDVTIHALDSVVLEICERLITVADGRQIVVPLSGGFDSRLIVLQLKRLGYDNLVAFSYGKPGNREAEISEFVAKSIGIPWRFVHYTISDWFRWFRSEERKSYYRMADGLCSLPHIQDWPAVWMLCNEGAIDDDAIIVPGHSADLPAGSRSRHPILRRFYESDSSYSLDDVITAILQFHFSLQGGLNICDEVYEAVRARVRKGLETIPNYVAKDGASLTESWDWRERQAKFIVNSVRVYDFWGYHWWLPFWDNNFLAFWSRIGLIQRKEKALFDSYVGWIMQMMKIAHGDSRPTRWIEMWLRNRLSHANYEALMRRLRSWYRRLPRSEYRDHPMAWYGIMNERAFAERYTGGENINSFLALEHLGLITFDSDDFVS